MPDYHEIKQQIEDGDVLLFRGKFSAFNPATWFSGLIRFWTGQEYTHVAIACWGSFGQKSDLYCWEATEGNGVRVVTIERYLKAGCRIDWFKLIDQKTCRRCVIEWFCEREGHNYASMWRLWKSFAWRPISEWLKIPDFIDTDRPFCSMAFGLAYSKCGFDGLIHIGKTPERLTPGDICRAPGLMAKGPLTYKGVK